MKSTVRGSGPLQPLELATASVMAAAAVAITVLVSFIPTAGLLQLLIAVPFGIVQVRHRFRAGASALAAAAAVSFLLLGTGSALAVTCWAFVGAVIGELKARRRGPGAVMAVAVVVGPLAGAAADAVLLLFGSYRRVLIAAIRSTATGLCDTLARIPQLRPTADLANRVSNSLLDHWAITVAASIAVVIVPMTLATAWVVLGGVLDRLLWAMPVDRLAAAARPDPSENHREPGPVPTTLRNITVRYPGAVADAVHDIDIVIPDREFIAIVGDNGSGKSTLIRILAGAEPTAGSVARPGATGLGRMGGTAFIQQRPDAQVLGSRVGDDVVWGLPPGTAVDVDALLDDVGLSGFAARDTNTLSGGQLQRLAIAAALARRPRLLISDESTAMVDAQGREDLIALLAALPRRRAMTVVHVTHSEHEAAAADRVVRLEHGRIAFNGPPPSRPTAVATPALPPPPEPPVPPAPHVQPLLSAPQMQSVVSIRAPAPLLELVGVGHAYAQGTPWQHTALRQIDLRIDAGEGVLICGDNGSGKSTLAWIMAGLVRPGHGQCLLDGRPISRQRGAVGLAFQNARLQLQRPTVGADILDAAGLVARSSRMGRGHQLSAREAELRDATVSAALARVGLDPGLASRGIDQLSGGQLRRVAIAGLLARQPRIVVLDEPLAGLDLPSRAGLLDVLAALRRDLGLTLVIVSHDELEHPDVCSRTVRLHRGAIVEDSGRSASPVPNAVVA
jgi:energy-coupling factor transporter ATP-binding protein EcfA2